MQLPLPFDAIRAASDQELLEFFYSTRASIVLATSGGSLRRVLEEPIAGYRVAHRRLLAAQEIVRRALFEQIGGEALSSPQLVKEYLSAHFAGYTAECFAALWLTAQHHVIAVEDLFRGTLSQTSVYPREVVRAAMKHNAGAVIFAHNHPSGEPEPSRADEFITQTLKQALALVDVRVIDHIVVGAARACSMAERGLL